LRDDHRDAALEGSAASRSGLGDEQVGGAQVVRDPVVKPITLNRVE